MRHVARVVLVGGILLFIGMFLIRELNQGWTDVFTVGNGKLDIIPLALAIILLGATYGRKGLRLSVQGVLISLVFLYLGSTIHRDWGQITERDWNFSFPWLAMSLALFSGLYITQANGWLLILKRFGHPVPRLPGFYVWSKSLLARYVPGNVLMVVGRVMMIKPYGVPRRISLTSIIYEQALLAAASTTVVSLALPLSPELRAISPLIWLLLLIPPLAAAGLHPAVLGRVGNFALRKAGREPIEEFLPIRAVLEFVAYYCMTWTIAGLGLFSLVRAVTMIDFTDLPLVIGSVPLAWLLAMVAFVFPSGLGVRELVYAFTLKKVFGGEDAVAAAFAIMARFWQTMIEIVFVIVIMGLVKKYHRKPPPVEEPGEA